MTTPVLPLVDDPAPPTPVPPRYGLYAAATVTTPAAGPWVNGVQYVTDACTSGGGWPADCGWGTRTVTCTITVTVAGTKGGTETAPTYTLTAQASTDGGPARDLTVAGVQVTTGQTAVPVVQDASTPWSGPVRVVDTTTGTVATQQVEQNAATGTPAPDTVTLMVTEPDPQVEPKTVPGIAVAEGTPFLVYDGIDCGPRVYGDAEGIARRRLDYTEQRQAEHAFWTGRWGNRPRLADAQVVAGADTPVGFVDGVAALEAALGSGYTGTGVLHAPRTAAAYGRQYRQVLAASGAALRTVLGTPWAFGTGYPAGVNLDGTPADPHTVWLVATGAVRVRRGPVTVARSFDGVHDRAVAIAERHLVITADCGLWAARVDVTTAEVST